MVICIAARLTIIRKLFIAREAGIPNSGTYVRDEGRRRWWDMLTPPHYPLIITQNRPLAREGIASARFM